MPSEPVLKALAEAWSALRGREVKACVMGGMAAIHWGHARFTKDIDLLVSVGPENVDGILSELSGRGFTPRRSPVVTQVGAHSFIQLWFSPKGRFDQIPVDLLIADSDFLRSAVERGVLFQLENEECRVVSCEDLIVLKLQADRLIDRLDVRYLLEVNRSKLDLDYLTRWIGKLKLEKEWSEWWVDAFPNEPVPTAT